VKPQTVAIVDDQITNLKILGRLAGSLGTGVQVRTFERPRDALASFPTDPPDLVITDFIMPEIDGAAFIRSVRTIACCDDVPVIVITAYEDRVLRYRALEAGATDFLLSPVDPSEFAARSRNLLTLRRQQQILKRRAFRLERRIALDERRHREALQRSHERLIRVIDAIPVMISATDRDGRFVFANRHFAQSLGREIADLIGRTPVETCGPVRGAAWAAIDADLVAGVKRLLSFEEVAVDCSGAERVLLTGKSILPPQKGADAIVVTVSFDITERKRTELELVDAMRLAEAANHAKTEFLANMSHELRTPLNAIIGFSEVIANEMLGPAGNDRYVEYAGDIRRSAEHLLEIINDVLDVAKIEAGRLELDETAVDPAQAVAEVVLILHDQARQAGIALETVLAGDLPRLHADRQKLRQILLNLVGNAVKFSPAGSTVTITVDVVEDGVTMAVTDRGIGMDPDEVTVALTRFGQVASPWTRRHSGTGLGLPLAIGLMDLHSGTLRVDSSKGEGTTVTIRFPPERSLVRGSVPA
jgi:two-component system cell cycle sensor histidine kinase PleC